MKRVQRQLIETHNRVLELVTRRGREISPGVCRWRMTLEVISGAPLTEEEANRALSVLIVEAMAAGIDVVRWKRHYDDDGGHGTA